MKIDKSVTKLLKSCKPTVKQQDWHNTQTKQQWARAMRCLVCLF